MTAFLRDDELAWCFAGLEHARGLLLAVSGGPDSMALLLMTARWVAQLVGAPSIHVATVDHGLRTSSRKEAAFVAKVAAEQGFPHTILTWTGPKPSRRVQERAREARYALLSRHARAVGATHVLTAHHADDQAETILFRLARGSGIGGLAGMRRLSPLDRDLILARPLLAMAKRDLVAICRAASCGYVEDPSNHDPAYARPRLRAAAPALAALGLDAPGLTRLARRMARADAALDAETDRLEAALAPTRCANTYTIDLSGAGVVAFEIALRLIGRGVAHVAGARAVRLERLESLSERLWRSIEAQAPFGGTLAGTRLVLDRHGVLTITAEPPRRRGRSPDGGLLPH